MSQDDFIIANQGFPAFRSDLNSNLQALASTSSGATAPSTTYANQLWYDTANDILKIRNEANSAWINVITLDQTNNKNSSITVPTIDSGTSTALTLKSGTTTAMTIDTSQNVGIGTSSPSRKLDVAGGARFVQDVAATTGAIVLRQNSGDTVGGFIQWVNNASSAEKGWMTVDTSSNMLFATVSSERMRIDSSGNAFIGATAATWDERLGVRPSGAGTVGIGVYSSSASYTGSLFRAQAENTTGANFKLYEGRGSGGGVNYWVDGAGGAYFAGNVGIGTSSPGAKLDISGSSTALNRALKVTPSAEADIIGNLRTLTIQRIATDSVLAMGYATTPDAWYISASYGGTGAYKPLAFATSDTERMRIDSSGNLLVGASSQIGSEKFGVTSGTTNATQYTTIATKGGSSFYIEQQQTTSVSTTATAILANPKYCTFCLVHGSDGTNRFSDVVLMSVGTGNVNVISSLTAGGTPSARTYSQSSSTLRVAMGSGTYTVQVTSLNMTS